MVLIQLAIVKSVLPNVIQMQVIGLMSSPNTRSGHRQAWSSGSDDPI